MLTQTIKEQLSVKLQQGVSDLGLDLSEQQLQQLLHYVGALSLWNKKFNLTAITDPYEMLVKHILDSMSMIPALNEVSANQEKTTLLDVGTGAGLPGVIIAICCPQIHCTVLDCNSKKIRFIRQVIAELKLTNVAPTHERIEKLFETGASFDVITSRAFASLVDFVTLVEELHHADTQILAMKGVIPHDEIKQLQDKYTMQTAPLHVPFLTDQRHLITLQKK